MSTQAIQHRVNLALRYAPVAGLPQPIIDLWPRLSPRVKRVLSGRGTEADYLNFWFSLPESMRQKVTELVRQAQAAE